MSAHRKSFETSSSMHTAAPKLKLNDLRGLSTVVPWTTVHEPRLQPLDARCASRGGSPSSMRTLTGVLEEVIVMETAVRNPFRPELVEPASPVTVNPVR